MRWGWAETAATDDWRRATGSARASAAAECLQCGGAAYRGSSAAQPLAGAAGVALGCLTTECAGHLSGAWRCVARPSAVVEAAMARSATGATAAVDAAARPPRAAAVAQLWPSGAEQRRAADATGMTRPIRTAPPPTAVSGDPTTVRAELLRWAAELGIGGGLDDGDDPLGAEGETALSRRLRLDVRARASETLDLGRLRTRRG